MTLSISSQGIVSGAFGSFTAVMAKTAGNNYFGTTAILKNDESGFFDFTTLMPSSGGTVGLVAGAAAIGSIIGRSSMPVITPVVTSNGAYAAGNEVGGLMTFPVGGAGTGGTLMSVRVTSKTILAGPPTAPLTAFIFTANPTSSTWTDKTNPAINTADIASLLCAVPLDAIGGLGTMTIWNSGNIGAQFLAANLYVVLITPTAITLTSTSASDITVELGMKVD